MYIDEKFFAFQKGEGVKRILIAVLGAAGLCCAQLMPADTPAKKMTAEDSLKAIKINAPVDYSKPVADYGETGSSTKDVKEPPYKRPVRKSAGDIALGALRAVGYGLFIVAGDFAIVGSLGGNLSGTVGTASATAGGVAYQGAEAVGHLGMELVDVAANAIFSEDSTASTPTEGREQPENQQ